jgi:hypothetical protein
MGKRFTQSSVHRREGLIRLKNSWKIWKKLLSVRPIRLYRQWLFLYFSPIFKKRNIQIYVFMYTYFLPLELISTGTVFWTCYWFLFLKSDFETASKVISSLFKKNMNLYDNIYDMINNENHMEMITVLNILINW